MAIDPAASPHLLGATLTPRQRCAALAAHLARVPADRFDLRSWVASKRRPGGHGRDVLLHAGHYTGVCGTTACAAGWATWLFRDPAFRLVLTSPGHWTIRYHQPRRDWYGEAALAQYFGLSLQTTRQIFCRNGYTLNPSARVVAARLRNWSRRRG